MYPSPQQKIFIQNITCRNITLSISSLIQKEINQFEWNNLKCSISLTIATCYQMLDLL